MIEQLTNVAQAQSQAAHGANVNLVGHTVDYVADDGSTGTGVVQSGRLRPDRRQRRRHPHDQRRDRHQGQLGPRRQVTQPVDTRFVTGLGRPSPVAPRPAARPPAGAAKGASLRRRAAERQRRAEVLRARHGAPERPRHRPRPPGAPAPGLGGPARRGQGLAGRGRPRRRQRLRRVGAQIGRSSRPSIATPCATRSSPTSTARSSPDAPDPDLHPNHTHRGRTLFGKPQHRRK